MKTAISLVAMILTFGCGAARGGTGDSSVLFEDSLPDGDEQELRAPEMAEGEYLALDYDTQDPWLQSATGMRCGVKDFYYDPADPVNRRPQYNEGLNFIKKFMQAEQYASIYHRGEDTIRLDYPIIWTNFPETKPFQASSAFEMQTELEPTAGGTWTGHSETEIEKYGCYYELFVHADISTEGTRTFLDLTRGYENVTRQHWAEQGLDNPGLCENRSNGCIMSQTVTLELENSVWCLIGHPDAEDCKPRGSCDGCQ